MSRLNPFGFLIDDPNYPFAHAQRTSFMDKVWAVWAVMRGPVRLNHAEFSEIANHFESKQIVQGTKKIVGKLIPFGLVDYLTLRVVWGPILALLIIIGAALPCLILGGLTCLGLVLHGKLGESTFGKTISGKALRLIVTAITLLLTLAAMTPLIPFVVLYGARMVVAAVLTVPCLLFALIAHGFSRLSEAGRAARNTVLKHGVEGGPSAQTLEAYLTKNKLSLNDVCFQKVGRSSEYQLMIRKREGNLLSTTMIYGLMGLEKRDERKKLNSKLNKSLELIDRPKVTCIINLTDACRQSLKQLQVPVVDEVVEAPRQRQWR